jgi:peroxiredoxin Q/BCP
MTTPVVDQPVEDFDAAMTSDKTFRLSDYQGRNLVLYFYPKDSTPGCTTEGQEFRDAYAAFQAADTDIVGVSRDGLKAHENFKARQSFPFELLSDKEETVCNLFGVIKMKNMYGRQVRGIERSTFLIDKTGTLRQEWRKVRVKGHVAAVLEAVQSL